jgi:hypothetical protein
MPAQRPAFTLWPWKVIALAVPAMALAAAVFAAATHSSAPKDVLTVFFLVLAAGNAYVFAMAIGDFGRSVLAIPLGALSGYLAVRIFWYPIVDIVYLAVLAIYAALLFRGDGRGSAMGCALVGFLFLAFLAAASRAAQEDVSLICALSSYPFVCSCVTAAMPLENTPAAVWRAGLAGVNAALHGLLLGVIFWLATMVLCAATFRSVAPSWGVADVVVIPVVVAALATNYFCVRFLFSGVHRIEVPQERPPDEAPPQEAASTAEEAPPQLAPLAAPPSDELPLPQPKLSLPEDQPEQPEKPASLP